MPKTLQGVNAAADASADSDLEGASLIKNTIITVSGLLGATVCAMLLQHFTKNNVNVTIVYMMAVFLIARFTDGYIPGITASFIGVICVNLVFTYPYMKLNFIIDGYPLTFIGMIVPSIITSATTTHLKETNRIMHEREKLLMDAEKEKMRANLLRAISHDLRTPLTSIIGTSSACMDNSDSISKEQMLDMFKDISDDSHWLLNMVENLLSVTRIRDNQSSVTTSMEPLEEVVSSAVLRFRKRLPDTRVHVSIPEQFIMIPMDATLIEQVIINLLENAVYHGKSIEPLEFKVTVDDKSAFFDIIDYGVGIASYVLPTIFDGSTTSPNASSDTRKGMGIGLSICKTIITAHGGQIYAANHQHGAHFIFTLPLGDQSYES